jgi:hypothetical protein
MIEEERKEETTVQPVQDSTPKRPVLLIVLCILTFAGSGVNFISSLFFAIFFEPFSRLAEELGKSFNLPGMDLLKDARPVFFIFSAAVYASALAGAMMMWRLRRTGFHIYTISQILLIMAPMYFLHLPGPSILDVILSGIFVILYSTNLKIMS